MNVRVSGRVLKKPLAGGSKSARLAIVLASDDGAEYVLRRRGEHAFADAQLEALVGRRIEADGILHGYTLLLTRWAELP